MQPKQVFCHTEGAFSLLMFPATAKLCRVVICSTGTGTNASGTVGTVRDYLEGRGYEREGLYRGPEIIRNHCKGKGRGRS